MRDAQHITKDLLMVENVPAGSAITVEHTGDAVTYLWSAAERHPLQWMVAFFGGAIVLMGIMMPVFFLAGPHTHMPFPDHAPFVISGINFFIGGLLLYCGLGRRGWETLCLSPTFVEFDTGPTVLPFPLMLFLGGPLLAQQFMPASMTTIHWKRKQCRIPATDLGPFTLERVGERQRLRVDHRSERIEIGLLLCEPDREWLAGQLQFWQSLEHHGDDPNSVSGIAPDL